MQPVGCVNRLESGGDVSLEVAEHRSQPAGRVIRPGYRDPEHGAENGQHNRESPYFGGNDAIQLMGVV
ncbi:hypothetical protein D3C71_1773510 [compost metagenome]